MQPRYLFDARAGALCKIYVMPVYLRKPSKRAELMNECKIKYLSLALDEDVFFAQTTNVALYLYIII